MSARTRQKPGLGTPVPDGLKPWVQTERLAHTAWVKLTIEAPRASGLLHYLVSVMAHQNAVVISQKNLAIALDCSLDTIQRAAAKLVEGRWIQVVRLGPTGGVNAYVINDKVAWGESRDLLGGVSTFSAQVVAAVADQPAEPAEPVKLRRIATLFPERAPASDRSPAPGQANLQLEETA